MGKCTFKTSVLVCLFFFFLILPVLGVEIVTNPARPLNKENAGRVMKLKEVLQINDTDERYYFKEPWNLKVSKDGTIFVLDKRQFLKFTQDGKYVTNLFKYGQGPSEVLYIRNYQIEGKKIHLHDSAQNKMIVLDHRNGEMLNEFRFQAFGRFRFLYYYRGEYYFYRTGYAPDTGGNPEFFFADSHIVKLNTARNGFIEVFPFATKFFVIGAGERIHSHPRSRFLLSPLHENIVYLSHTQEYGIKIYDVNNNKIIKQFSRPFERVETTEDTRKFTPGGGINNFSIDGKNFIKMPHEKYLLDIQELLLIGEKLWVVTTSVKNNKVLVDVYNKEGIYQDKFYLECPPEVSPYRVIYWIIGAEGNSLFFREDGEEGNIVIKKMRIE